MKDNRNEIMAVINKEEYRFHEETNDNIYNLNNKIHRLKLKTIIFNMIQEYLKKYTKVYSGNEYVANMDLIQGDTQYWIDHQKFMIRKMVVEIGEKMLEDNVFKLTKRNNFEKDAINIQISLKIFTGE